jgi:hypothetical protein
MRQPRRTPKPMTAPAPKPTADMCTRAAKTYDGLGRGAAADTAAIARALAVQAEATRRECEAEIARLTRERDGARERLAEADTVIATLEDGAWAYGTTEDDLAKLNEWRAEALARHAARAKGDG